MNEQPEWHPIPELVGAMDQMQAFYRDAMAPYLKMIEDEMSKAGVSKETASACAVVAFKSVMSRVAD